VSTPSASAISVSDDLELRPTTSRDLATLRDFFSDSGFNQHWGGRPLTDDEIRTKDTGQRSPQVECFLVEQSHAPIGFIQYWVDEHGGEGGGIDFALVPAARGVGIGTMVVQALVQYLLTEHHWPRVTVDPDIANVRGVNFWKAAGFRTEQLIDHDPERVPYQLMSWPIEKWFPRGEHGLSVTDGKEHVAHCSQG